MPFTSEAMVHRGILRIKPYTPGTTIQEAVQAKGELDFIKIASNENPFGMSPKAAHAIRKELKNAHQYPEKTGVNLRESLAARLDIAASSLVIGNGADGVIYALLMCLIDEGDQVIIPEMTFSMYETVVHGMRGEVVYSRMNGYEIDLEDILARITDRTKLIIVCNPNNPTGSMLEGERLFAFFDAVPRRVLILHDEAYYDFADGRHFPDVLALLRAGIDNVFVLRTFSKLYGLAGVRVGYGVGTQHLIEYMHRIRPPFDVSVLAQAAGCAALEDTDFAQRTLTLTNREKHYIYRSLDALNLSYVESQTNFVLLDAGMDCRIVYEALLNRGIIVRASLHKNLPTHIRITVGKREHNRRFITALREVLREAK